MTFTKRIEELQGLLTERLAEGVGVGHSLGVLCAEMGDGRAVYTLKPSLAQANVALAVHGGVLTTLMDNAMGSAVFTQLPDAMTCMTLELKANFIRPVSVDDAELRCEATTVHVGSRTATAQAQIVNADGKLVAHGTCTCVIQPL